VKFPKGLFLFALAITAAALLQSTLAANINLSSSGPVEFGQGIQVTTACSGSTSLVITPNSSFVNASGAGAFYFSSVRVSNIPSTCYGVDFSINAYGETSTAPLALFNSTFTNAVVYNNAGTFERGAGTAGASVTSGSGTFTITFTNPVALSGSVYRLTIQSGTHVSTVYNIGSSGPGGGVIFYISNAGFNCGPTFSATGSPSGELCHYLEAAPSGWNTGSDPTRTWAQSTPADYQNTAVSGTATGIGWGFRNTRTIIQQGNSGTATSAAALADSYAVTVSGGVYDDWYLPSRDELNQMCKWARGVAWISDDTLCSGGTLNTGGSAGFMGGHYWSSSEWTANSALFQNFNSGNRGPNDKNNANYLRPVRAF